MAPAADIKGPKTGFLKEEAAVIKFTGLGQALFINYVNIKIPFHQWIDYYDFHRASLALSRVLNHHWLLQFI